MLLSRPSNITLGSMTARVLDPVWYWRIRIQPLSTLFICSGIRGLNPDPNPEKFRNRFRIQRSLKPGSDRIRTRSPGEPLAPRSTCFFISSFINTVAVAIVSWRHLGYFVLLAKVYSGKGIIQSIHSTLKGKIVRFLRCPSCFASAYTFSSEIVLVYVHGKKSYCPIFPFTIFAPITRSREGRQFIVKKNHN